MFKKFLDWIMGREEQIIIATHDGSFHADDVFSVAMLKIIFPYAKVIRTRDLKLLKSADFRVDVGEVHNPETGDYDHHQRGGAGTYDNGIKKSSIGLVWDAFGLSLCNGDYQVEDRVRWNLIQLIDAGDNGIKTYDTLYDGVQPYHISRIISCFNPTWDKVVDLNVDSFFEEAVDLATIVLKNEIENSRAAIKARVGVLAAVNNAQVRNSKVVILEEYMPWIGIVTKNTSDELYTVFPTINGEWRIQCIPENTDSFDKRKALPRKWAGASKDELNKLIGINDAIFAHNARFIAGAKSFDSIMKMAKLALEE